MTSTPTTLADLFERLDAELPRRSKRGCVTCPRPACTSCTSVSTRSSASWRYLRQEPLDAAAVRAALERAWIFLPPQALDALARELAQGAARS